MSISWKALSDRKLCLDDTLRDEILAHWSKMDHPDELPLMIRKLLKENIEVILLFFRDENDNAEHQFAFNKMIASEMEVYGSMDASTDDEFRHIYELYGWRTMVYVRLNINQPAIPEDDRKDLPSMMINVPALIVSNDPYALNDDDICQSILILNMALAAMLLRVGMTLFATRSQCLWDSIPGMLMLVSPDSIFRVNQHCLDNLKIPQVSRQSCLRLGNYFPESVCRWISRTIGSTGEYTEEESAHVFWLDLPDGRHIRAHMTLIPYRQWAKIQTSDHMSTGFYGISMLESDRLVHLLLIQDTTREWKAETLEHQMDLARRMQQELLPASTPCSAVLKISAVCQPASNVGGDIYDFASLDDGRIAIIVGDATGHGVDSALLAAVASGAFRATIHTSSEPNYVLESMDKVLRSTNQSGFVTLSYLLFSADGLHLDVGLAGHYPPVICRQGKLIGGLETPSSLPLGVNLPPLYHFHSVDLTKGDLVAAISDGFLECRSPIGDTLLEHLPALFGDNWTRGMDSADTIQLLLQAVQNHTAGRPIDDDLTAVAISVNRS